MKINVGAASSQASRIREYSSELREVRNKLTALQGSLSSGWQAEEIRYINQSIEKINREIVSASSVLNSIAPDIVSAAYEIKREEDAKEAAEKAKAEAAAAAAAAKTS
ncbi:WXG100 family type VII secretion target [Neobacillus bataviensis]|uniref:WXG100 family type VII secretion target n=1 Tax=Neobacillus bataviensis TaxID=220685 RepID=UPI001CBC4E31|nr:WXG100 family type VII secretion target [Neobacillus bataviensis]